MLMTHSMKKKWRERMLLKTCKDCTWAWSFPWRPSIILPFWEHKAYLRLWRNLYCYCYCSCLPLLPLLYTLFICVWMTFLPMSGETWLLQPSPCTRHQKQMAFPLHHQIWKKSHFEEAHRCRINKRWQTNENMMFHIPIPSPTIKTVIPKIKFPLNNPNGIMKQ